MDLPPLILERGQSAEGRRLTRILQEYWNTLRGDLSFPSEKDVQPKFIRSIWENCFVVEANNASRREDYKYKYLGKNIIAAYGQDLTGLAHNALISAEASLLADEFEKILAFKRPVFSEGMLHNQHKQEVRYRQVLLPLGENGIHITAILGGMSYKIF